MSFETLQEKEKKKESGEKSMSGAEKARNGKQVLHGPGFESSAGKTPGISSQPV